MDSTQTFELGRQIVNYAILALGCAAVVFVLRDVFKITWKIIRLLLILLALLVIIGEIFGWIHISFL
jgi:hypothetical protein